MIAGIAWSAIRWRGRASPGPAGADRGPSCSPTSPQPRPSARANDDRRASVSAGSSRRWWWPARRRSPSGARHAWRSADRGAVASSTFDHGLTLVPGSEPLRLDDPRLAAARPVIPMSAHSSSGRACRSLCRPGGRAYHRPALLRRPVRRPFGGRSEAIAAQRFPRPARHASRVHNCRRMSTRGEHLVHGDRGFATGGGAHAAPSPRLSRQCWTRSPGGSRGGIETRCPRERAPHRLQCAGAGRGGAPLELDGAGSSGDSGFGRLVQGLDPRRMVEPGPRRDLRIVLGKRGHARRRRPRQGPVPLVNALAHRLRDNAPRQGERQTSPPTMTWATISIPRGSTRR